MQNTNRWWTGLGMLVAALGFWLVAGCGPDQHRYVAALSVRQSLQPDYRDALLVFDEYRANPGQKNEFARHGMCGTAVALYAGDAHDGLRVGKETYAAVTRYENMTDEVISQLAAEDAKFFKGEPHERVLMNYYAGLAAYLHGDFNTARMYFTQALFSAKTRDEDASDFRDDCRLGSFWYGRALLRLGETDRADTSFRAAGVIRPHKAQSEEVARLQKARAQQLKEELKLEAQCYKNATTGKEPVAGVVDLSGGIARADMPAELPEASHPNPVQNAAANLDDFLKLDFQKQANLIIVTELGVGPFKHYAGLNNEFDVVDPLPYKERFVDVYVDGHKAGPAFELCDVWHEATTRGVQTRRTRQIAKGVAKEALKFAPFAGSFAGFWDVSADVRFVPVLPGSVQVFAARVTTGLHTIALRCYDINEQYLPRYDVERHFISVDADNETTLILPVKENENNDYLLQQVAAASAARK